MAAVVVACEVELDLMGPQLKPRAVRHTPTRLGKLNT
jgi:hypothetical protein